jgi:hypothetical protein
MNACRVSHGFSLSCPYIVPTLSLYNVFYDVRVLLSCRILELLGAEVRVFNPAGLPMKDEASETHPKVEELRDLSIWSEAQVSNLVACD